MTFNKRLKKKKQKCFKKFKSPIVFLILGGNAIECPKELKTDPQLTLNF